MQVRCTARSQTQYLPSSSHISAEYNSYGQWSVAKVQVKHIMHYLGGLFSLLRLSWICFVCICACVYIELERVRERFCSFFREKKIVFASAFTHAFSMCACWLKLLSVSSLCMCIVLALYRLCMPSRLSVLQ